MVDSSEARTPAPAEGLPCTCSAGHVVRHPLIAAQVSFFLPSFVNSYKIEPAELTRILPSLVLRSSTVWKKAGRAVGTALPVLARADPLAAASRTPTRKMQVRFTSSPP